MNRLPLIVEGATVGLVEAAQDLDQRRLPGAVVSYQAEHLAAMQLHADVDERGDGAEAFADVFRFQDDGTVLFQLRLRTRRLFTCTFRIIATTIAAPR